MLFDDRRALRPREGVSEVVGHPHLDSISPTTVFDVSTLRLGCVEGTVTTRPNPLGGAGACSVSMSGSTYIDRWTNHHANPAPIPGLPGGRRTDNYRISAGAIIRAAYRVRVRAFCSAPARWTAAASGGSKLGSRALVVLRGRASRCAVASQSHRSGLRFRRVRSRRLSRQRVCRL